MIINEHSYCIITTLNELASLLCTKIFLIIRLFNRNLNESPISKTSPFGFTEGLKKESEEE